MSVHTEPAAARASRPARPERRGRRRSPVFDAPTPAGLVARYTVLVLMVVISVGPMLWELSTSLKSKSEDVYSQTPNLVPQHPTLKSYHDVMELVPVLHFAGNSLIVAVLGVVGNLVGTTFAGFALARLQFRGRKLIVGLFLATLVLPGEATIISQFQLIHRMGLSDSLLGVALPGMIGTINVLLMRNAFRAIPSELDDAAIVDGANAWQRLRHIGLPAVRGTMALIAIMTFIGAWDDFLWPLLVIQTPDKLTLTVGLDYLSTMFGGTDPRLVAAGTLIALVPVLVFFVVLQRHFFKGVEEGAVKG